MAQVTELITKFSFQGSTSPLTSYNEALSNSLKIMGGMVVGLAGLGAGMSAFIQSNLSAVDAMGDLASRTGLSIEAIQKLGYVAQLNGSSVEAMNSTLESLTQKIGLASRGGEMELKKLTNEFGALGISVKKSDGSIKNAEELIYDLQDAFSKLNLSTQEKAGILSKLGIDKTMIDTLSLSSEAMKEFTSASEMFGVVTAEQAEQAGKFNDNIDKMVMAVKSISMQLALSFAPKINDIIDGFMEFLKANKELIKNGLSKFMEIIGGAISAIINVIKLIYNVIDVTIGWENVLKILGAALLFFNAALLASPITWIVAGIVGLVLVIDDLMVAFEGGESAIRDFFLEWFGWDILPSLKNMVELFKSSFGMIRQILTASFSFIKDGFVAVWNGIVSFFKFDWLVNGIKSVVNSAMAFLNPILEIYNKVSGFIGGGSVAMPQVAKVNNPMGGQTISNNRSQSLQQDIKIDIKTNDAKTVAPKISQELNKYMKDSATQFKKGGR